MITTTLEQSKRLEELGAPQDTVFVHHRVKPTYCAEGENSPWVLVHTTSPFFMILASIETQPCYTLQELIEWLGDDFEGLLYFRDGKYTTSNTGGYHSGKFYKTPLEAVFALAISVKETK